MAISLPAMFAIQGGSALLGGAALGSGPRVPNLVSTQMGQNRAAERSLNRSLSRQRGQVEEDLAAAGVTGSGGGAIRERLFRAAGDARAQLAGHAADSVADARNRMAMMQFGQDSQRHQARGQALGEGLRSMGTMWAMNQYMGGLGGQAQPDGAVNPLSARVGLGHSATPPQLFSPVGFGAPAIQRFDPNQLAAQSILARVRFPNTLVPSLR